MHLKTIIDSRFTWTDFAMVNDRLSANNYEYWGDLSHLEIHGTDGVFIGGNNTFINEVTETDIIAGGGSLGNDYFKRGNGIIAIDAGFTVRNSGPCYKDPFDVEGIACTDGSNVFRNL